MRRVLLFVLCLSVAGVAIAQSAESDQLFAQGTELYKLKKYQKAIALFERCDSLDELEMDSTDNRRGYAKHWMASCYFHLGDTATASLLHYAFSNPPVDRRLTIESDSAAYWGDYYYNRQQYHKALEWYDKCRELEIPIVGENHYYIANDYIHMGNCEILLGDTATAANYIRIAANIRMQTLGMHSQWTYVVCCDASYLSSWAREHLNAKVYMQKAMEVWRNLNGTDNDTYLRHLHELNNILAQLKDLEAAADNKSEELSIRERMAGKENVDYIRTLNYVALYLYRQEKYDAAAEKMEMAINLQKKVLGEYHPDILTNLNNLCTAYAKIGKQDAHLRGLEQMLDIMEHAKREGALERYGLQGSEPLLYKRFLYEEYLKVPNNEKALAYAQAFKEELDRIPDEQKTKEDAKTLTRISTFEFNMGINSMSIEDMKQALDILTRTSGKETKEYLDVLLALCQVSKHVNDWSTCIHYSEEYYNTCERIYGHEHAKTAESMMLLGDAYFYSGDDRFIKSMELHREGLELTRRTAGERSIQYAYALMDYIDDINVEVWSTQKKIDYLEEAVDILIENYGPENSHLFRPLHDIAAHQVLIGEYDKAATTFEQLLNMKKRTPGTMDKDLILLELNLCTTLYYSKQCGHIADIAPETQSMLEKQVYRSFSTMTEYERDQYWRNYSSWFDGSILSYAKETDSDSLKILAYDAQLFSKGLLLNTEISLQQIILQSGDSLLLQQMQHIHNLRAQLNRQQRQRTNVQRAEIERLKQEISLADSLRWGTGFLDYLKKDSVEKARVNELGATYAEQADSLRLLLRELQNQILGDNMQQVADLQQRINNEERQLVVSASHLNDKDWFLAIRTEDVARNLPPASAAIEFVCFQDSFVVDTMYGEIMQRPLHAYYGFVLKHGQTVPQLVRLCSKDSISALSKDSIYTTHHLSDIIWQPLRHVLSDVKNVYFSPTDELNRIAIEYLPGTESWNLYRLSSTRELVTNHKVNLQSDAILYGGIQYELSDSERALLLSETFESTNDDAYDQSLMRDLRGAVETVPELPGSFKEVESIGQLLREQGMTVSVRNAVAGSEESFKALSGKPISVLHISTHGFYEQIQSDNNDLNRHLSFEERQLQDRQEDLSLSRSGLLLAGSANYLFEEQEDDIPRGEDGILTAKEISRIDLNGVNLVVLSACETGLGDITADGVFGLQRGFKKAGVHSILMSLWKVDDESTCLLMTEFYENWIHKKMTKHDALEIAKNTVRSHKEKGWDDPKYWAAFILLDGLN